MEKKNQDESIAQKFQKLILEKHPNLKFPMGEEVKKISEKFTESIQIVPLGEKTPWQK